MDSCLHREAVANRKVAPVPDSFRWYQWQCVGPDIMFTGSVVTGVVTKGPRKGKPRYSRKPEDKRSVVVTDAESDAEYVRYESETGKCGNCKGEGKVWAGWHHETGSKYAECRVCLGSGLVASPPSAGAVDPHA